MFSEPRSIPKLIAASVTTCCGVWLLLFSVGAADLKAETKDSVRANGEYRGKVFLGLGVEPEELPEDKRYQSTYGLRVKRVAAESSAEKAGLRVGDMIVSMDGSIWKAPEIRLSVSFGKAGKKFIPGEVVRFEVLRERETERGKCDLKPLEVTLVTYPGTKPELPHAPSNDELRPDLEDTEPGYRSLCWNLIRASGYEDDCQDLLLRLRNCEEFPDPHRLSIVRYVHRDPFKLEAVTRELVRPLREAEATDVRGAAVVLDLAEHALDRFGAGKGEAKGAEGKPTRELPAFAGADLAGHLQYVEAVLKAAAEVHTRAFERLSEEDVKFIIEHRKGLLDSYVESRMLSYDSDYERQKASVKLMGLVRKVEVADLLEQARLVSRLVSPDFTESLRKAAEASGKDLNAGAIMQRRTDFGTVLVAGKARTRYEGDHYAAIYDLGGDDVYANNLATSVWGKVPSAVIVDYDGDDAYEAHEPFRQGCGDFGVGLLCDLEGDDTYIGTRFTQGCGFLGVGMLLDGKGNDIYRGIEFHQGVGHWGVGALVDSDGDDRYESHDTSQGVGLPGGLGIIWDRGRGRDRYYCKGKEPTGYGGSPGVFEGWGQGLGVGYRPYASGGLGLIYDAGGADRFEAGNFSQGGGYFYGFGILYNAGTDPDVTIGSRYAQGFGCHQSVGSFIDEGGDDRYQTRQFVAQGLAWDEAVALFLDQAGDDRYEGGGFSHGASAMNGWTLFIEGGGTDTYLYTDQARAGGNSYHGGTSLSFFLDLGGQEDRYPSKPNNAVVTGGARSLFVDLPGSLDDALKGDAWKALLADEKQKPKK